MLNLGVLYISIYKNWSLLSWLAFIITSLTALTTVWAVESLILLWIDTKSNEKTYGLFALLGFAVIEFLQN